jgi:hypothetical protein
MQLVGPGFRRLLVLVAASTTETKEDSSPIRVATMTKRKKHVLFLAGRRRWQRRAKSSGRGAFQPASLQHTLEKELPSCIRGRLSASGYLEFGCSMMMGRRCCHRLPLLVPHHHHHRHHHRRRRHRPPHLGPHLSLHPCSMCRRATSFIVPLLAAEKL